MLPINGVKLIALIEFLKGVVVFALSIALFELSKKHIELQIPEFLEHIHIASAGPLLYSSISKLINIDINREGFIVIWATIYSFLRFAEAYGLWSGRKWGFMIGIISVSLYLPIEIFEIIKSISYAKVIVTTLNLIILIYLIKERTKLNNDFIH